MTLEEFKATRTISAELSARNIPVSQNRCHCPFHEGGRPSFTFNDDRGLWFCHTCNAGGSVLDLIARFRNETVQAVIASLFSDNGHATDADRQAWRKRISEAQAANSRSQSEAAEAARRQAEAAYQASPPATSDHPYLTAKRVGAHGDLRLASGGALFIPLRDAEGALWSRQTIDAQGEKLFLLGGRVKGCYFPLSDRADGPLLIAEGYATAASCLEATGWAAWMALNTGNLEPVAQAARQRFPDRIIVLAADNDRFKLRPNGQAWNPGREAAQAAAKLIRALVCHPEFADEDTQSTDFNDLHRLAGAAEVRRQISEQIPSPLSFLSYDEIAGLDLSDDPVLVGDHVLTQGSLAAILAPGGVGKSRLVQQLAAACVAGHERFLAWEIHPRARELRWIICQAENSAHRLLEERARLRAWLGESAWTRFNRQVRVLVPLKEVDSCLDLDQPEVVARLRQSFQLHLPDIVVFDALYNFSLRELSKGAEMLAAVSACSRVARYANPRRSPILLHHALPGSAGAQRAVGLERATYGRDSKILHQLARSVINLTAISEDSNDQLLVTCGKCSDGREFHPFIIRLNPDTLIYECDPSANVPEVLETVASKKQAKSACPPDRVRELTNLAGSTKAELAQAIMDDCGIWKTNAYRHIARALKHKTVRLSDNGTVFKN